MNPNKALWEKGDFTRIAQSMRESGEALVKELGITKGLKVLDSDAAMERPHCRRRSSERTCWASISRATLSRPGTSALRSRASPTASSKKAMRPICRRCKDHSFDLVVSIFGAMFAPKPFDVAKEMVRVTRPGGRIVMGNWIPNDPTLVAQILKISSAYSPPPPEGFISPMTWGVETNVIERFAAAGVPKEKISFVRDTYTFNFPGAPSEFVAAFKTFYGPTMNAFEAAEQNGRAGDLQKRNWKLCSIARTRVRAEAAHLHSSHLPACYRLALKTSRPIIATRCPGRNRCTAEVVRVCQLRLL